MVRSVDVGLFVLATALALAVGLARLQWGRGRTVGAITVALALIATVLADRRWIHALPAVHAVPDRGLIFVVWGAVVSVGAARASRHDASGLALPGLCVAAGVGVWAGVPETSYAIVAVGLIVGVTVSGHLITGILQPSGAVGFAILVAGAGWLGAVDIDHALAGAVLGTMPLVLLAVVPVREGPSGRELIGSVALALGCAVAAGRLVGVHRTWDGVGLAGALCVVLAAASVGCYARGGAAE